ncbi:diphosphomevalonate decarboxylase, partial [Listeria innocua FSL S4-378]
MLELHKNGFLRLEKVVMRATAIAHTNVALIKYWGKRDEHLILPANSSLSFTVDKFYTKTTVEWDENLAQDTFILNNEQ